MLLFITLGLLLCVPDSLHELEQLPVIDHHDRVIRPSVDWLVVQGEELPKAKLFRNQQGHLVLDNGLIQRTWKVQPNLGCIAFDDRFNQKTMLRSIRPEAQVVLNGQLFDVGGLAGQKNHAFLTGSVIEGLKADSKSFRLVGMEQRPIRKRMEWKSRRHRAPDVQWPPPGVEVCFEFAAPSVQDPDADSERDGPSDSKGTVGSLENVRVFVHYEMYDGLPLMSKWVRIENESREWVSVNRMVTEQLALVEHTNWVETRDGVDVPHPDYLHVETDFAFGGFNTGNANRHVVHWEEDPTYSTQVNYLKRTPCLLSVHPTNGPEIDLKPGQSLESYRTFELVLGDSDRERRGLARRRMMRTIAPWVTENPITHHLLSHDPKQVRRAIDQAVEVGFEAIILSFGSGFNMESQNPEFLAEWKQVARYAEERGVELGAYSLFSSRGVGRQHMIVSPEGVKPTHGQCPAVTSAWGQNWLRTVQQFYEVTGFDQFENDGPYPGDVDVTPRPPLQKGEADSRWVQWRHTTRLYRELRAAGVYINAPDYYYLNGTNKCGMGYRETNWSLPREHQPIHTRQNIFDGTWTKTPSMGWMFVPLTQYHGGGAAATIEPLNEHIDHYRRMLMSNFGMGVQAHYRGPRLFDSPQVRDMVRESVDWFKKYRDILESDLIHGRRADGRNLDWMLHVNPSLTDKGMICIYNPTDREMSDRISVDLYYTGLRHSAVISREDASPKKYSLEQTGRVEIDVFVPAGEMVWYVVRDSASDSKSTSSGK